MHNNRVISDPKAISDGFNNYFVNIGLTLASKYPITIFHIEDSCPKTYIFHYS